MARSFATLALLLSVAFWRAGAQGPVMSDGFFPFSNKPIGYLQAAANDPIAKLQQRIASGGARLTFEPQQGGYLRSLLDHLRIPVSSQLLVVPDDGAASIPADLPSTEWIQFHRAGPGIWQAVIGLVTPQTSAAVLHVLSLFGYGLVF